MSLVKSLKIPERLYNKRKVKTKECKGRNLASYLINEPLKQTYFQFVIMAVMHIYM